MAYYNHLDLLKGIEKSRHNLMRILFIEPRVKNPVRISVALPMTFLSLYSYVMAHIEDVEVCYHSMELDWQMKKDISLASIFEKYKPDVVLSSAVSCNFSSAAEILKYFKTKGAITMLGGIFASSNDKWVLEQHSFIDIIVQGEGERVLLEVLTKLQQGRDFAEIGCLSYRHHEVVTSNKGDMTVTMLDDLPPLNFNAIPVQLYKKHCSRYYVFAARGCKYDCDFCSLTSHWGHKQRRFSSERVLHEIDRLVSLFEPHQISFGDDTLDLKSDFYRELLTALSHRQFPVKFGGKTRIDLADADTISLLKDAGFSELSFGVESNDKIQLKQLNKGSIAPALDRLRSTLQAASDEGFRINLNFILGTIGETTTTLRKKADFIIEHCAPKIKNVIPLLAFLTPHPGTRLCNNAERLGLTIIDNNFDHYNHLQPVCLPRSLGVKGRSQLIETYNYIAQETGTEQYNPLLEG